MHTITINAKHRTTYTTKAPYWQALQTAQRIAQAVGALSFSIRSHVPQS